MLEQKYHPKPEELKIETPKELEEAKNLAGVKKQEEEIQILTDLLEEEKNKSVNEQDKKLIETLEKSIEAEKAKKMFEEKNIPLPKEWEKRKEYTDGTWSIEIDKKSFIIELQETEDEGQPYFIIRDEDSKKYKFFNPPSTFYGSSYKAKVDTYYFRKILNNPSKYSKEYLEILEEIKQTISEGLTLR